MKPKKIRWIRKNLGISSYSAIKKTPNLKILDIRDLVDKEGNSTKVIKSKINEGLHYLQEGKKVAVCCDYGISRSNAIAAGILSELEGINFEDSIKQIIRKTGEKSIKVEVLSAVRKAIKQKNTKNKSVKKKNILITGGAGFIGKSIIRKIAHEYNILTPKKNEINLLDDTVKLDLLIKEKNINTIVHLANPRIYTTNEAMGKSLLMLKNILDVCRENNLFLIFPSSWEIYSGYKGKNIKADENLQSRPGGTYGQTKLLCESLIELYHNQHGLKFCILRSSPIYGPESDKPKFIWNFLEKAKNNHTIFTHKYTNGYPKLDLMYIDDFVNALQKVIKNRIQGPVNIGSGVGTTTNDVAKLIVKLLDSKSQINHTEINEKSSNVVMKTTYASKVLKWHPKINLTKGFELLLKKQKIMKIKKAQKFSLVKG